MELNANIERTELTDQFPPEIQEMIDGMLAEQTEKIEAIGRAVAKKRDAAIKARKASGIEQIWMEDEEYYQGVDDANRDTHPWVKSASTTGGISRTPVKSASRCSAFFNITRQFVESASARMGDILLPVGDWNFSCKATPVQDLKPFADMQAGQAATPEQMQVDAVEKALRGETKIKDWLVECSYHTEVRKVIEDAAKLGTGVLKGPFPDRVQSSKIVMVNGTPKLEIVSETAPKTKYVSCWDFYPDPSCGEDIHQGNHVFEKDRISAKQLRDLKGQRGYLAPQIDKVLDEGPGGCNYVDGHRDTTIKPDEDDKYEVFYFYGLVEVGSLEAMDVKVEGGKGGDQVPAVVVMVNDTPIKAFLNPQDSGAFPYDIIQWQRIAGSPWGMGIARQGRTAQDMLNAAARALMDNAGLSSGPMIIIRRKGLQPADGRWEVTARKLWFATEEVDMKSVADAILSINIPMVQVELTAIIQMATKMMEDATGIFLIMQGQQGSAPDTVGGMELLHRNASTLLRRFARVFDERITEPHIRRYHHYLMLHGPDDCKGDMKVEAIGSTALVEREIQSMEAMVLLQMSKDPAYGLDPAKAMTEVLKIKRFIPEKWQMDEATRKEQMGKEPFVPAIEVAKIKAAQDDKRLTFEEWKAKVTANTSLRKMEVDTDRDQAYVDSMSNRDEILAETRMQELQLKERLAILEYANKRNMTLDKVKSELAREGMRLSVQKELAGMDGKAEQVATPATEPPQHAADGRSFQE